MAIVGSVSGHTLKGPCMMIVASILVLLASPAVGREVSAGVPSGAEPAGLAFTRNANGEYTFDTGVLRGTLRQGGRSVGLSSVVHLPSGARLDRGLGIAGYYRVFTTNKRYGHAAWDWPSTAKLLPDGAVQVTWPAAEDRPFEMAAVYRWTASAALDVETIVTPTKDLSNFEVFLASYFQENFASPYVYVREHPEAEGKPGFRPARKSFGDWQMFPRDEAVLDVVRDGRWKKEPNPVDWVTMPRLGAPVCLRRAPKTDLAVVLMSPPDDCFAIATPYEGEGHYSLYLSLFGRGIKAGETAKTRARFVVATGASDRQVLALYRQYFSELSERDSSAGTAD